MFSFLSVMPATAHIDSLVACLAVPCRVGIDKELPPGVITAGASDFTLRILGTNLEPDEEVLWNGAPLTTTHVNSGEKRAVIRAVFVSGPGTVIVTLAGFNSLNFRINFPPVIETTSPLPTGIAGFAYSRQLVSSQGTPPHAFTLSGTLPPGLNLSATVC